MSVEVVNETEWDIDPKQFSNFGLWVMGQMRVSLHSDLSIAFVEPDVIAKLHEQWMDLLGPTDVMSFPMDELRPGDDIGKSEGILGDIIVCPDVAQLQAQSAGHGVLEECLLLTAHGILHLLGFDHTTPEGEHEMFALQRQLLLTFLAQTNGQTGEITKSKAIQGNG